jgi:ribose/xylose/arabinose/galactoside ABC-type transport system permease subunit
MAEAITQPTTAKRSRASFADYAPTYGAAAALVLLILANVALTPNFADADNFRNILVQVTPTMLVAIGMTFVIATGGIDLSVGSLMAIASAVAAISLDYGAYPAMLAALVVVTLTGAFNGWLISTFKIQPIIVTLALLIAGRGIAQVISNGGQLIPFFQSEF